MINNDTIRFELRKFGKTKYHSLWGYGTLTSNSINYTGIVQFSDDYRLVEGSIYEVKSIDLSINKKGVLQILLALK